jgi:CheY-like chemotaxis protein
VANQIGKEYEAARKHAHDGDRLLAIVLRDLLRKLAHPLLDPIGRNQNIHRRLPSGFCWNERRIEHKLKKDEKRKAPDGIENALSFFQEKNSSLSACLSPAMPHSHQHVLIIEDNPDGREALRSFLQIVGYRVEVASNGLQGLEKALAHPPDTAIVDIGLPFLDGYQLGRRLRAQFGRSINLFAYTGYGQAEDRRKAFEAGFDVHLVKPVDVRELCFLIDHPDQVRVFDNFRLAPYQVIDEGLTLE